MLSFQSLLREEGIDPRQVRLLRHAKGSGTPGLHPFAVWRNDRDLFHEYQSSQPASKRAFFDTPYWAAFVGLPNSKTVFVGMYSATLHEKEVAAFVCPLSGKLNPAGFVDLYATQAIETFHPYSERLFIDWGAGKLSWRQFAHLREKPIVRLLELGEEPDQPYPGHSALLLQLSEVVTLPLTWQAILSSSQGVYLLSSAHDKQQYVGSACGYGGFFTRWAGHAAKQGDAVAFRLRNPEDYRVSILEVAGSAASADDILRMEQRWKEKLQSREMGLNRN